MNIILKTYITFIIVFFQSNILANSASISEEEYNKQYKNAQDEFLNYLPKIELLEEKYADDPEFLLGSAILYTQYANTERMVKKIDKQWERILSSDPNNKAALATVTIKNTQFYTTRVQTRLDELESKIMSAKKRGVDSITIPYQRSTTRLIQNEGDTFQTSSNVKIQPELYKYFSTGDNKDIVIKDFDAARITLKEKLTTELAESIDLISNAENRDTDNALYNYLKANIYFEIGNSEPALEQVRIAGKKKFLNTYFVESRQAVFKVLELINFPEQMRQYITDRYSPIGPFIIGNIEKKILEPAVTKYEKQGQTDRTEEIFNMASLMAEQIRKEPMPYETINREYGDAIEKWVETSKNYGSSKISNPEVKTIAQNIYPRTKIVLLSSIIMAIAGLIILLRKTKSKKA
jgi:hypothetical protein